MTFGSPIWLYLIPPVIAALVAVDVLARRARLRALERFAAPALLPGLLSAYSVGRSRFKAALMALGIASLFVALARPQIGYEWREVKAKGVDLVIAMDVSKSMLARDIKPDRLERAKLAVLDLIDKLKGDRIGLVAFSGEAFLQCPLTLDYDAFRQSLEALDTDVIPREGTDLGAAISEAVAAFDVTSNQKVVVLITDGEDLEGTGLSQAKKAAEKGVVIYTVGVGTPQGDLIPVRDAQGREDFLRDATNGKIVTTRLEDSTLVAVADAGHGFYTPLGPTGEGLWKVYESGWLKRPQEDLAARQQRTPIERFQWPLALSIFLFAWEPIVGTRKRFFLRLLRRRAPTALVLALALFAASDLRADGDAARDAYAQGDYEKAAAQWAKEGENRADSGRADFNQGASLYKLGDYAQAAKAFTAALAKQPPAAQKDTFFNLGNTRFMQGLPLEQSNAKEALAQWEQALKDYDNALELAPKDADATHNRAYVQKRIEALKKREEEKKKQQEKQQNQQQQNQNQQNQNQQNQNQDQQQNKDQKDQQNQQNQSQQNQQQNQSSQNDQNQKQDQKQNQEQKDQNQQKQDQQNKQQGQDKQPQNQQPQNASQNQDQKQDKSSEQNKEPQEQKDKDKQQGQSDKSKQDEEKQKQDEQKSGQGDQQKQEPKPEEKKNEPGKDQSSADKDKQEQKDKAQPEGSGKDKPEQKPQPPRDTRGNGQQDVQEQRGPDNKGIAEAPKPAEEKPSAEQKAAAAAQAEREKQAKEEAEAAAAAAAAGVMTRQDAGFLLDSLKTQERKLPAAPIRVNGQPQDDNTRKTFKNW